MLFQFEFGLIKKCLADFVLWSHNDFVNVNLALLYYTYIIYMYYIILYLTPPL